jgi:hypothetical protein
MTRYTVVWDEEVEGAFIDASVAGDSRTPAILTEAANWVDANLAEDPDRKGRPVLEHSARVIAVSVSDAAARVSATYQYFPAERQVRVICLILRGL